jgi:predicted secreted hydrolase
LPLFALGVAAKPVTTWEPALPGYTFAFPRDFGAHERSRNEWWYYTGNLRDARGRRFGFEETIFRFGVQRPIAGGSPWDIDDLYFAHFAITDASAQRFAFYDRTGRAALGGAGAVANDEHEWLGDWRIERGRTGTRDLHARAGDDALDLRVTTIRGPVVNGRDGVSRKGSCATCASHYYSIVDLRASGTIVAAGRRFAVTGTAWNDHEWGSDELAPGIVGWDWFSVQLNDGAALMLYRLRYRDGRTVPQSSGTFVRADRSVRTLARPDFFIERTGTWTSPHSGAVYPAGWLVRIPAERISIAVKPMLSDQELTLKGSTKVSYWEGACEIEGSVRGKPVHGYGYTELTGYAPGGLGGLH